MKSLFRGCKESIRRRQRKREGDRRTEREGRQEKREGGGRQKAASSERETDWEWEELVS